MPPPLFSRLQRVWLHLLDLAFAVLCCRFLVASNQDASWTCRLIVLTGFGLAWWRPSATLFALLLGFSLLAGLEQTVFLFPLCLPLASAIWLAVWMRAAWFAFSPPKASSPKSPPPHGRIGLLFSLLATVALGHVFVLTLGQFRSDPSAAFHFWHQASHGPGSPFHFLSLGFLWLHGLFYFRAYRDHRDAGLLSPRGIRFIFLVNSVAFLFFFGLQWLWDYPYRWTPGLQSPFDDIGTFGAIAASFFIFHLAWWFRGHWGYAIAAGLLATPVIASWSRGSWLAAIVSACGLAFLRLPRYLAVLILAGIIGSLVFLNMNAARLAPTSGNYLARLISLVRFENPQWETGGRLSLYYRALGMIRDRPLTGHGLGSFYTESAQFAAKNDILAGQGALPHNLFLQLATEQGLPVALLFAALMLWLLWRGLRCWWRSRHGAAAPAAPPEADLRWPTLLALTFTLTAYLQANLTWDILLMHSPQPFFFWFLVAALLTTLEAVEPPPRGLSAA